MNSSLESNLQEVIAKSLSEKTELCHIMSESGSDKCSDWHNYTPFYSHMFLGIREENLKIFELGIFKGCSLRGWKKYFFNSKIYAADVNIDYFVNNDGIESFFCDQDSKESIELLWKNFESSSEIFDVMIDDGKHEFNSNLNFLNHSIHMLKKGGIFVIEDLTVSTKQEFQKILKDLKTAYNLEELFLLEIPNNRNFIDNCLLIIRK